MNPIILELIKAAVKNVASDVLTRPIADRPSDTAVANKVTNQLKDDPVFINETNSEPASQSRVVWGSVVALLTALTALIGFFASNGFNYMVVITNWAVFYPLLMAVGGAAYALYGRLTGGLKPIGDSRPSALDPVKVM